MKITNILQRLPKGIQRLGAALGVAVIVAMPLAAIAEFYPARPVFDYNKMPVNGSTCTAADADAYNRCGSMTGPVFNSFINTPHYGDERAFLDGRKSDAAINANDDQINDVTNGTKEVVLRTYVHNNANQNFNASGVSVAKGAKVRVSLPTGTSQVLRARSYISANNAAQVEDTADLVGSQQFSVEYVAGSAKLLRGTAQYALSDSIVTTGALIGDKTMDGNYLGCFEYASLVEIRVKIKVASYDLNIDKQVRKHVDGQTGNWANTVNAAPGDKVDYLINTSNGGTAELKDVITRDVLPPHVKLVPGTIKFYTGSTNKPVDDTMFFQGGYNGGNYLTKSNTLVVFTVTVLGDFTECSKTVRNVAYAKSSTTPEINDTADVTITRPDCNPTTHPAVTIDKKVDGVENKEVAVGQNFTYQLVVKNTGDVKLTNVVVTDQAPANVQFVSTDKGTITNNALSYTIPELAVGASQTINIVAKVTAYQTGSIVNTACVNAPEVNPTNPNTKDDCDDATVTVTPPVTPKYSCDMLSVTKLTDNSYKFTTAYTATNGATFQNVSYNYGDGGSSVVDTHTYSSNGTYNVVATVNVIVDGVTKSVSSANCAKTVTVNVVTPTHPAVTIDKKVDGVENKEVAVGQNFTYQLVVKNTGDVKLTNVVVTDQAPANVQFVSTDKGTITNNALSYTIPELAVGASQTINIVAKVTAYQTGSIVNTACVNAPEVNPTNPNTKDDCDDATVTVTPPVTPPEKCTVPGKTHLPKNDPACKPDHCTYPGMEDKAPNDPACKPCEYNKAIAASDVKCVKPAVPTSMPVTGAEGMIGLFAAVTVAAAAAHQIVQSRRYS